MGVVAALVVAGAVWFLRSESSAPVASSASDASAAGPVTLEGYGAPGEDPFVESTRVIDVIDFPALVTVEPVPSTADDTSGTQLVNGATPLLYAASAPGNTTVYGGSNEQAVCDPAGLIDYLTANPDKATAWAGVFGLDLIDVPDFVRSLTPIVLLRDTAVTNHGFAAGEAVARQSVLQAGTAVMVDEFGVPAVRCACGNPLLPPEVVDFPTAEFRGDRWSGFDPGGVFSVTAATSVLTTFTVVDVVTGQPLDLRSGSVPETLAAIGEAGVALSDDGVTWHPVPGSPAGRQIASGGGTLLALGASQPAGQGRGTTAMSSVDGGLTWTPVASAPADATFATYDGARWLLLTEPTDFGVNFPDPPALAATVHSSTDLTTWTAQEVNVPLDPLPPADFAASVYTAITSFGAGDGRTAIGVLLADAEGTNRQYLLSSTDLATWQKASWESGSVVHPTVAWDGRSWGMTAFRYDGALRDGDSHGLAGPAAADLSTATLSPTNDDVGLGSLDYSTAAGWIAAGWRGADWQDPALYTSSDLATWARVGELPGHGFDVAAVTVAVDLTGLPELAPPVLVTGTGCPPVDGEQSLVTAGQLSCAAIARVGYDASGPYTGGNHVAPKWHHWGCDWYVLPEIDAGRWPSLSCGGGATPNTVEFWAVDKVPTGATAPTPAPGTGDDGAPGAPGGDGSAPTGGEISVSTPMATPACDGTPIVIYASAVTPGRYSADIQAALDAHPGASWVRTDRSCSSLAQATADGGPIYAVYQAFPSVGAACAEVGAVGGSAGRRLLDNGSPSTSVYSCP